METSIRGTSLKQQIALSLGLSLTEICTPNKTNDSAVQETSIVEPITPCKTQVKSTKFANKTLETDSITIEDQILHDDQEPQSEDNNEKTHGSVHKTPKRKKFKPKVIQDRGTNSNKTPNSKPGISNPSFSPQTPNSPSFKAPITPEPKPNNMKISINSDLKPNNPKDPIAPNPKLVDSNESIIMDPFTPLKPDIVYGRRKKKAFIVTNEQKDIVYVRRKKRYVNINNDEKDMGIHDRKINVDANRAGTGLNCDDVIEHRAGTGCDDVIELVRKPVQRRLDFAEEGLSVNKSLIGTTSSCEDLMREVSVGTELVPTCLIGTSPFCEDLMEECNVGTELAPKSLNGTDLDCEDALKKTNLGTELDPNSSIGKGLDCEDVIKETNIGTEIYPNLSKSSIGTDQNCEESKSFELVSKDLDRVTLKENISLLAIKKFPGIKMKKRQKVTKNKKLNKKFEKLMNELIFGMKNLNLNSEMYAIVPYKEKKHRGKVILDEKTIKEWNIIMRKENSASSAPGADLENEIFWRTEREIFSNLAESFIAQMKLIQGDRRFSEWKGSVVDSVVGAYLTQNVSDHMSSSAFISLASRFPQKTSEETKNTPKINNDSEAEKKGYKSGKENIDWDALRRYATQNRYEKERETVKRDDSVNWDAVRKADVNEVAKAIHGRGMDNVLAKRIQDFLNRVAEDHEKVDLEWLREVDGDQAKEYLLSIYGLGLKSVECIRLLTLHQAAFPVDTNVGRICVRLGWVPLQPLPESLQIHLLELYPVMDSIQKYLWPRLCKLDQKALYELHYQMITFGKVFCTKNKPNCNACPLRSECKHFASAFASARLMLPGPNNEEPNSIIPIQKTENPIPIFNLFPESYNYITEPIIEEPSSPIEENQETLICSDIEDVFADDDPDEIPTIKLDMESFVKRLEQVVRERNREREIDIEDISRALVVLPAVHTSIPLPKLKNPAKLRTVHDVYEIPDSHSILKRLDLEERDIDDPSHYLFVLWTPEKEKSSEPKKPCRCRTCKNCEISVPLSEDEKNKYVEGSILIPCRTAMRGSFPLNGTYFQVNEVFADHVTSRNPIRVSRDEIWRLRRLPCYCGTSVTSVLKGLPTDEIQFCFWRGFICVREFDREKRSPKALSSWLHNRPSIKTNK